MKFTYLLIDFFTIIVPLVFSFHPKIRFDRYWKHFLPAATISALAYIAWDIVFTEKGYWGFNSTYFLGWKFINLPLEEVLFFFCIPFSCVFTFHCMELFRGTETKKRTARIISFLLVFAFLLLSVLNTDKAYTFATFLSAALIIAFIQFVVNPNWMFTFYLSFALLIIPFLVVNGLLTGTGLDAPVVWYSSREIIGMRVLTIPVEDFSYALTLLLLTTGLYKYFRRRNPV